jgi:hypothetical protein
METAASFEARLAPWPYSTYWSSIDKLLTYGWRPSHQNPTREKSFAQPWLRCCARLPTHLAHPLKDDRTVVAHALGASLQGQRQNRGELCRLLPANIPG